MKYLVISGSSRGIGQYLAKTYLEEGFGVVGLSRSKSTIAHKNYHHYCVDLMKEEEVLKTIDKIKSEVKGPFWGLLNNAGMASMNMAIMTSYEKAMEMVKTNLLAPFLLTRELARLMALHKQGRVINFSTIAVPLHLEGESLYSATKAGLEQFAKTVAKELVGLGITVNNIGPSPIQTDLVKNIPPEKMQQLVDKLAIKEMGSFEQVKTVCDFFLSEKTDFITGQTIYLGGIS